MPLSRALLVEQTRVVPRFVMRTGSPRTREKTQDPRRAGSGPRAGWATGRRGRRRAGGPRFRARRSRETGAVPEESGWAALAALGATRRAEGQNHGQKSHESQMHVNRLLRLAAIVRFSHSPAYRRRHDWPSREPTTAHSSSHIPLAHEPHRGKLRSSRQNLWARRRRAAR